MIWNLWSILAIGFVAICCGLGLIALLAGAWKAITPTHEADQYDGENVIVVDELPIPSDRDFVDPRAAASELITCRECGELFNPGDLDAVIFHEVHRPMPDAQYSGSKRIS